MEYIHSKLAAKLRGQIEEKEEQLGVAQEQLKEALSFGDLSENAEYTAARKEMHDVMKQLDSLKQISSMPVLPEHDDVSGTIEEGCVVSLEVFAVNREPSLKPVESYVSDDPLFKSVLLFGGGTPYHTLVKDGVLSADTKMARGLVGKRSGVYEIQVPDGFAIVRATVLGKGSYDDKEIGRLELK